mmetsp:Transcript_34232/g.88439  ORF Transcript_34232/g.88439 Transcript_34232/m.88439 type:complete len:304 (-) Transcript_34232:1061-1972(-)
MISAELFFLPGRGLGDGAFLCAGTPRDEEGEEEEFFPPPSLRTEVLVVAGCTPFLTTDGFLCADAGLLIDGLVALVRFTGREAGLGRANAAGPPPAPPSIDSSFITLPKSIPSSAPNSIHTLSHSLRFCVSEAASCSIFLADPPLPFFGELLARPTLELLLSKSPAALERAVATPDPGRERGVEEEREEGLPFSFGVTGDFALALRTRGDGFVPVLFCTTTPTLPGDTIILCTAAFVMSTCTLRATGGLCSCHPFIFCLAALLPLEGVDGRPDTGRIGPDIFPVFLARVKYPFLLDPDSSLAT